MLEIPKINNVIFRTIAGIKQLVSGVCLGTAQYGSQLDETSSYALMDRFVEKGGNFLDTAHVYGAWDKNGTNNGCGNSEVVIGRWLKSRKNRDRIIIGTKGGHPDFESKKNGMTCSILLQHLQESLDRLQTDFIDIYWFHRDNRLIPVSEILGWLEEPCKQGMIRTIGCSHWRKDRLVEAMTFSGKNNMLVLGASQIAWSLAQSRTTQVDGPYGEQLTMDKATWEFHVKSQLPLIAYNTQAAGFFAKKYDACNFTGDDFPKPELAKQYGSNLNLRYRAIAQKMAGEKGCSTNQIALAWLLQQPFPVCTIIGPRNFEQLDDSMDTMVKLNNYEWQQLRCSW
ncbi:MAG: hypothetical protein DRI44_10125 [Chlamydiae bacterium]|nr:MAG: hypothetical protein DRI44_10125 [Chlamydiota bacterium]